MDPSAFHITVLMPCYNVEMYVTEAVQSILNQTYRDFEFLIIDDGSTDRTAEILSSLAEKDSRIRLRLNMHRGFAHTLNEGLRLAQNDWVASMDADDISLPNRLEEQVNFVLRNPDVKVVATYGRYMGPDGRYALGHFDVGPVTREEFFQRKKLGKLVYLIHPSVLMDRNVALEVGGYRDMPIGTDVDLWNRIADNYLIQVIPKLLYVYRIHPSSTTTEKFLLQEQVFRFVLESTRCRRSGVAEPTYEDFVRREAQRPWLVRMNDIRRAYGIRSYRLGGMNLAHRKWLRGCWFLFIAVLCRPRYALNKLYRHSGLKSVMRGS